MLKCKWMPSQNISCFLTFLISLFHTWQIFSNTGMIGNVMWSQTFFAVMFIAVQHKAAATLTAVAPKRVHTLMLATSILPRTLIHVCRRKRGSTLLLYSLLIDTIHPTAYITVKQESTTFMHAIKGTLTGLHIPTDFHCMWISVNVIFVHSYKPKDRMALLSELVLNPILSEKKSRLSEYCSFAD